MDVHCTQGCHSETHQLLEGDLHRPETASLQALSGRWCCRSACTSGCGWGEWCACWLSECSSIERRACYAPSSPLNTPSTLKTSGQQGRGKRATFTGHALLHTWDNAGRPIPTFQTYGKPAQTWASGGNHRCGNPSVCDSACAVQLACSPQSVISPVPSQLTCTGFPTR